VQAHPFWGGRGSDYFGRLLRQEVPPPRAPEPPAEHKGGGTGGGAWDAGADADIDAEAEAPCWAAFEPHYSRCEFEGFATGSSCISLSGSLDGLRPHALLCESS
jgi:hypothetical protein